MFDGLPSYARSERLHRNPTPIDLSCAAHDEEFDGNRREKRTSLFFGAPGTISTTAFGFHVSVHPPTADCTFRNIDLCAGSRCLFGERAIRRKVSRRRIVGRRRWVAKCVDRISNACPADCGGQLAMADRKFDREFLLRRHHRRPTARYVLPPHRSRTGLRRHPMPSSRRKICSSGTYCRHVPRQ
jgi:hypothetical protein